MSETVKLYSRVGEIIDQVIRPSLGEYADDYDIQAIAEEATSWVTVYDHDGNIRQDRSGFSVLEGDPFWEVVAKHELAHS